MSNTHSTDAIDSIEMSLAVGDVIKLNRDHCIKRGRYIPRGYSHATYLLKNTVCKVFWAGEEKKDSKGRVSQRVGVQPISASRHARVFVTVTDTSVDIED